MMCPFCKAEVTPIHVTVASCCHHQEADICPRCRNRLDRSIEDEKARFDDQGWAKPLN